MEQRVQNKACFSSVESRQKSTKLIPRKYNTNDNIIDLLRQSQSDSQQSQYLSDDQLSQDQSDNQLDFIIFGQQQEQKKEQKKQQEQVVDNWQDLI